MREQFECVRITSMNRVDISRFEFDFDTTWNAFFLDAKLNVYSRYGGRDGSHAEARLNRQALLQTMAEVLAAHNAARSGNPGGTYQPVSGKPFYPEDIPLLERNHQGCVHCHHVREYSLRQAGSDGTFDRQMLFPFPLPDSVGIRLDLSHGHRVEGILPDTPAARSTLQPGDVIVSAAGTPIRSEYDFRWVLNHTDSDALLGLVVQHPGDHGGLSYRQVELWLRDGWRAQDLSWRKSLRSIPFPLGFKANDTQEQLETNKLALRVGAVLGRGFGNDIGLHTRDVILAIDGRSEPQNFDQFRANLLRRYQPGDRIRFTIRRGDNIMTLSGAFPEWGNSETYVP